MKYIVHNLNINKANKKNPCIPKAIKEYRGFFILEGTFNEKSETTNTKYLYSTYNLLV